MSFQYDISRQEPAISEEDESQFWAEQLARYLRPYQERLDAYVDRRVVGNLRTVKHVHDEAASRSIPPPGPLPSFFDRLSL